jgi:hypothetical protein
MPAGRPKGSTGPTRWTPSRIAQLFEDADTLAGRDGPANKEKVAGEVKKQFPDKYRDTTEEQMRQQLCKKYLHKKTIDDIDDIDAFNADVLAHLLGEK